MRTLLAGACAACAMMGAESRADQIVLEPAQDNTLYEDPAGAQSNGIGTHIFAGTTVFNEIRRALLAFDVAGNIPAGSTIDGVTLTLNMSRTIVGPEPVSLHRTLAGWGEGASDAPGEEGIGALPEPGDVTWLHTFFPDQFWAVEGGEFAGAPSATTLVDSIGPYAWSSAAMAADVQSWLDDANNNFGWCVVGNELIFPTAKRFDSRENPVPALRPILTIDFTPPSGNSVAIAASQDNTLYEDSFGGLSNGAGQHFFAGRTDRDELRRGLLQFDIANNVPPGSDITSVELTLHMSRTIAGPEPVTLHKMSRSWGEGTSDAPGEEGEGAPATIADATWAHRFFFLIFWFSPGGDFVAAPRATEIVDQVGFYTWTSTPQLIGDVEQWLNDPAENDGWCIVGNESALTTAKRFDTREHPDGAVRPVLVVHFEPSSNTETICPDEPDDFQKTFGGAPVGNALDTCESDNVRLKVPNQFRVTPTLPFIRVDIWANTSFEQQSVQSLTYIMEGGVSAVVGGGQNPDTMRTSIRRYGSGWVLVDERATSNPTFDDEVVVHNRSNNVGDFISNNGQIRIRVEAFDPGTVINAGWELRIDQFNVVVSRDPDG